MAGAEAGRFHTRDRASWRQWLKANADGSPSVWQVYDKGPGRVLSYDDIAEKALCFGLTRANA